MGGLAMGNVVDTIKNLRSTELGRVDDLMNQYKAARSAVGAELLRQYPIGTKISFSIRHGQKIPSTGTVVGVGFHPGTFG